MVWKVCWWMGAYGSPTPKRQYAYSCSKAILRLDVGWKRKFAATASGKTVRKYKNKKGESRYVGTRHLRETEFLVFSFSRYGSIDRGMKHFDFFLKNPNRWYQL